MRQCSLPKRFHGFEDNLTQHKESKNACYRGEEATGYYTGLLHGLAASLDLCLKAVSHIH